MILNVRLVSNVGTVLNPPYSRAPKHLVTPMAVWNTSKCILRSGRYSASHSNRMSDNPPPPRRFTSSPPCAHRHSDHVMKTDALLPLLCLCGEYHSTAIKHSAQSCSFCLSPSVVSHRFFFVLSTFSHYIGVPHIWLRTLVCVLYVIWSDISKGQKDIPC